jgi:hypothetical protein
LQDDDNHSDVTLQDGAHHNVSASGSDSGTYHGEDEGGDDSNLTLISTFNLKGDNVVYIVCFVLWVYLVFC